MNRRSFLRSIASVPVAAAAVDRLFGPELIDSAITEPSTNTVETGMHTHSIAMSGAFITCGRTHCHCGGFHPV